MQPFILIHSKTHIVKKGTVTRLATCYFLFLDPTLFDQHVSLFVFPWEVPNCSKIEIINNFNVFCMQNYQNKSREKWYYIALVGCALHNLILCLSLSHCSLTVFYWKRFSVKSQWLPKGIRWFQISFQNFPWAFRSFLGFSMGSIDYCNDF